MKKPDLDRKPKVIITTNEAVKSDLSEEEKQYLNDLPTREITKLLGIHPELVGAAAQKKSIQRMQSVEKLIQDKMMLVDTAKFQVAMLAELWNLYFDEGKKHLCQNIMNYCKIKNAYDQLPENANPVLLISIKDSANEVTPYAYFKNGEIELIENTEVIRNFDKENMKRFRKMVFRIGLIVVFFVAVLLYFIL